LGEVRLAIGVVIGTHGVQGELKVRLTTDDPEHLAQIKHVFVSDEPQPRRINGFRIHGIDGLFRLKGISTPEAAAQFKGATLRIAGADARPLEPGEFYIYQLIGLNAFDESGAPIGVVSDILETGANDVLVISPPDGGPDQLVPNHPDVVLNVDPKAGKIVIRPLVYDE
jgi:16S rRNA processing protein RimM